MMKTKDVMVAVSRRVDTKGTQINAADTSRVVSELFAELADQIKRSQITELDSVNWFVKELEKKLKA